MLLLIVRQSPFFFYFFFFLIISSYVLNEWCKLRQEQATIRNLLNKIADLGRKDVFDMMLSTINLFKYGICKDSGIQNSNQTLASIK